jgi:hypothetical protein
MVNNYEVNSHEIRDNEDGLPSMKINEHYFTEHYAYLFVCYGHFIRDSLGNGIKNFQP